MTKKEAIEALAEYFTGPSVGSMSVALQVGGMMGANADRFFKARSALGIEGYDKKEEALLKVQAVLL